MISVIIPTLNEEKYLPILLESIKKQTYKDYEVIIGDGNSTDKTINIAKKYGCKIAGGGSPAVGRNKAAKKAKGEYLIFLDADVFLPDNFFSELLEKAAKYKFDVASSFSEPDSPRLIDKFMVRFFNFYCFILQKISPHASGMFIFIKKSLHVSLNGFNEKLKLSEDHDYVVRAAKHGKFSFLTSPRIKFSVRRFNKEGRAGIILKYLYAEIYRLFHKEIKKDIVKYEFGNHE